MIVDENNNLTGTALDLTEVEKARPVIAMMLQ